MTEIEDDIAERRRQSEQNVLDRRADRPLEAERCAALAAILRTLQQHASAATREMIVDIARAALVHCWLYVEDARFSHERWDDMIDYNRGPDLIDALGIVAEEVAALGQVLDDPMGDY